MRKKIHSESSWITVTHLKNDSVVLAVDEDGCKYLIEELQYLLANKDYVFDYDQSTGYDCGILSKNSLGLIIVRKDFK